MSLAVRRRRRRERIPYERGVTFEKVWAMFQETREQMKENAEEHKKTERFLKKLGKQMGDLHNSFGEMAEHLVAPAIHKRFNELGYHFSAAAEGGYVVRDNNGKILAQVDILLINDDYIIAVEVKATVRPQDIEHHIKRIEILKEHWNKQHHDTRIIRGAIAGAIFGNAEKEAVIEAGFYALVQSGDTMKMEIPEDFVPREF